MANDCKLTTIDNPFDPFEQFDSWLMFDKEKGYNSCERLARIAEITDDMTQKEIDDENERAIDEIIKHDIFNVYQKVTRQTTHTEDEKDSE
jgi:hypothetical protein